MLSSNRSNCHIFGIALTLVLVGCGGEAVIDSGDGGAGSTATTAPPSTTSTTGTTSTTSTGTGTTTSTSTNTTTPTGCSPTDSFCACWGNDGCYPVGAGCLCYCDYQCPGEPPCECGCGGGDYLGCAPKDCPQHDFPDDAVVMFDGDGCPYQVN